MNPFNISGLRYVGYTSNPRVNNGQPVPLFEPVTLVGRPSINTMEGWNVTADKHNRRSFAKVFGREPVCTDELRAWEESHFSKDFQWGGTKLGSILR